MPRSIKITGQPAPPETRSWHEYLWQAQQATPERLEDAAKFLAGMISVSLTLFIAIGRSAFEGPEVPTPIRLAVVIWLAALVLAFLVLFPWRYRVLSDSAASIKAMHRRVVRVKQLALLLSLALFLAALVLLTWYFFLVRNASASPGLPEWL